jgi:hypothetical protein
VVDAKEPLRLALGVGALEPGQAEGAGGEGLVGVGQEEVFALFWEGGEDWVWSVSCCFLGSRRAW